MSDTLAFIHGGLAALGSPTAAEHGGVRVPTTTLLPGGALVSVLVTPQGDGLFRVSDAGGARLAMLELGVTSLRPADRRRAGDFAADSGLWLEDDELYLANVGVEQIGAAVVHVADVSRRWATWVVDARRSGPRAVEELVGARLEELAPRRVRPNAKLLGASNAQHEFDFAVEIEGGRRQAVFEIVTPAPQSIAFTHLKFADLGRAHADWPREAIMAEGDWPAEQIALLGQVATHVRASSGSWEDLRSILN